MATLSSGMTTEQRILAVATELFYEKGYHAATMREVAAAVGIKAGSLYNHFPGKQDLLFRIAYGTMEELLAGGRLAVAEHDEPPAQLRALVRWHVGYHALERFKARVADEQLHALDGGAREQVVRIRDEYTLLFKDILETGRAEYDWYVPSTSVITFAIAGMCTFVDQWYREDGPLRADEIADMYADFVLAALAAGHPSMRAPVGS